MTKFPRVTLTLGKGSHMRHLRSIWHVPIIVIRSPLIKPRESSNIRNVLSAMTLTETEGQLLFLTK